MTKSWNSPTGLKMQYLFDRLSQILAVSALVLDIATQSRETSACCGCTSAWQSRSVWTTVHGQGTGQAEMC